MIHYLIYTNKGTLIDKTTPDETEFLVVSVFGNAESISSFDKDLHRIWTAEPNHLDVAHYQGFYKVFKDEFEEWGELLKTCSTAKERMEVWVNGHE